jgi:hypothetical protein
MAIHLSGEAIECEKTFPLFWQLFHFRPYTAGQSLFEPEKAQPAGLHYGPQPYPKAVYAAMVTSMNDYIGNIL